jgi:Lrp/AsnC family transcriptional regulator for asnA, asnC and gidA
MSKIDTIDRKIINLLLDDGRMTASEIARQIGLTERSVRYRIERLIQSEVIKIAAVVNPEALGYSIVADVFIEVEPALINQVARRLAEHENITYVACSIGERDVSAQVVARDNAEVYALATEFIGKLPGVRKTTTSIVPIRLKDVYQWRVPLSPHDKQEAEK